MAFPLAIVLIVIACVKADKKRQQENRGYYVNGIDNPRPKPPREKLSASAIMLLIGTAFIILSAITFVAANWVKMQPSGRVPTLSLNQNLFSAVNIIT